MEKAKELFNHVPSDESVSLTAWFNLALSLITVALSTWYLVYSLLAFSLVNLVFAVLTLAALLACMYFNKRYIDGIKERDATKMAPFRFTFVLETVIDFVYYNIVGCIIMLPIAIYMFKIFNSLYVKIRDEKTPGNDTTTGLGNSTTIPIDSSRDIHGSQRY